ncbi:MAG: rhodanese-like domain-containing protein [Dehalococcoidia bacterium]
MELRQFVTEALGDSSYVVVSDRTAAVIDPQRDVRPYLEAAAELGATIEFAVETHVHNDYISGGPELAALGAMIVAPATAGLRFPHQPIGDGEDVAIGRVRLGAVAAPGHTYEHTAYLLIDEDSGTSGAFTGGALLVGGAGRTDLLGPDHTEELTRMQWDTARRLKTILEPDSEILPTHGGGSFCSWAGSGDKRRSTLAHESDNDALVGTDFATFRAIHLGNLAPIPAYYPHIAPINRAGPSVHGQPPRPPELTPQDVVEGNKRQLVDVRRRQHFVEAHVPGSLSIEEGSSMLAYFGWVIPFNSPLALVTEDEEQAGRVTTDLFRIGYESVAGYLLFQRWLDEGQTVIGLPGLTVEEAREAMRRHHLVDVRFANEHERSPLAGALQMPSNRVTEWAATLDVLRPVVACATGRRAVMVASFLKRAGLESQPLVEGGVDDLR